MEAQNTKPTAIDLFAGGGGLSLGFSKAGFDIVLALDNDADACRTYRKNNKKDNGEVLTEDIGKVNFGSKLRELGLTKGGIDIVLSLSLIHI